MSSPRVIPALFRAPGLFPGEICVTSPLPAQLSVTVSALNVCFSISIHSLHLDGAEFRGRWLVVKVISGVPVHKRSPERLNLGKALRPESL